VGEPAAALAAARRRIRLETLEETGYRVLMELQAEVGDRAVAVSTYHRCASVLEHELGVAPGATLRRALQRRTSSTSTRTSHRRAPPPDRQPAGRLPRQLRTIRPCTCGSIGECAVT
jgi:DNA-binding SARP family transcriptional activator